MKKEIIGDLSKLTNVPRNMWDKIIQCYKYCIEEYIYENKISNSTDDLVEIDLGYGILVCKVSLGEIKMKFIPNEDFVQDIKASLEEKKPKLLKIVEKNFGDKLSAIYKDLI